MFATDSLNMAVEELWQLALSCATLKYILGTVAEEVTNDSKEFEEESRTEPAPQIDRKGSIP